MSKKQKTATSKSKSKLRIGNLLLEEGLITKIQLDLALEEQKKQAGYRPLGQICLELNLISRHDLQAVLRKNQNGLFLGELLLNMGLIQQAELEHMLQLQKVEKQRLGQMLVSHQIITEHQLVDALSVQLNIPHMVPRPELIDTDLLTSLDFEEALILGYIPLHRSGSQLTVVMTDPLNTELLQELKSEYRSEILPAIATYQEIERTLKELKVNVLLGDTVQMLDVVQNSISGETVLMFLLNSAADLKANFILIEPADGFVRIRFRRHGVLQHQTDLPLDMLPKITHQVYKLTTMESTNALISGACKITIQKTDFDLKATLLEGPGGESLFLNLETRERQLLSLERLGLNPHTLKQVQRCLDLPEGLFLVVGPKQAGKRSVLYATLDYLNDLDKSLFSLEDDIFCTIAGVHQLKQPKDSSTAIYKDLLRFQPDVLLQQNVNPKNFSEIMDLCRNGIQVIGGVSSLNLDDLFAQIGSWGVTLAEMISITKGILFTRQIRTLCPECKLETQPSETMKHRLRIKWGTDNICYQPAGCDNCQFQGYTGVTSLFEFWEVDEITRTSLLQSQNSHMLRSATRQLMITMLDDGIYKALLGTTSLTEVLRIMAPQSGPQLKDRSASEIYDICRTRY